MNDKKQKIVLALACGAFFGIGWISNIFLGSTRDLDGVSKRIVGDYKFISPLIACNISDDHSYLGYESLNKEFSNKINSLVAQNKITHASVYFRDLNSGRWTGYNEDDVYWPASLMKVPTLIALLATIEKKPELLAERVIINGTTDEKVSTVFKPAHTAENKKEYSVEDLANLMIRYSDNNAAVALSRVIGPSQIEKVFSDGGVELPKEQSRAVDYLSPREYAYFFRLLYNATYLNRAASEYSLQLLSTTDFDKGIVAGVPAGVSVAHKFGEHMTPDESSQLHDCGIVYHEKNPYLLCIMTKGKDFEKMASAIAEISDVTYKQVTEHLSGDVYR